ncbi:MAG TPA: lipid-binding SYLF domain-containing protein [Alphaproteobacteria bacterium]
MRTHYDRARAPAAALLICASLMALPLSPAAANDAQKLVDDATSMVRAMLVDPDWQDFNSAYKRAKAVVLVPDFLKAGFVVGGAGGQCLMVARSGPDGAWSAPSFCLIGEASFGLQIGAQKSEVLMLVMTDGALERLASGNAKLGGNAGLSVGLIGAGVQGATTLNLGADIYAFARSQGLYGGVALDGGWIGPDTDYNQAYYGRAVSARNILIDRRVTNPATNGLLAALDSAK